ncbi:MAG: aminopeptidase P family protein [Acidobacteria bacterium]|nr:aminopeptidase P family protein [Acidobacteriota bacterium]
MMRFGERQMKLRHRLREQNLDGLLVTHIPNIRYVTGFTGSTAMLLITDLEALFVTDSRYVVQASQQVTGRVVKVEESYLKTAGEAIQEAKLRRVGFESAHMTHQQLNALFQHVSGNVVFVPTGEVVETLRQVKEPEEAEAIRQAVQLTSEVFEEFIEEIKPGVRERDLALELEYRLRQRGAEKLSFDTIIASGHRSALPHGIASDKRIDQGFVVCDFGIVLDGYCSDMTRTVYLGNPDSRAREIYDTVLSAQLNCEEHMRAGMENRAMDALTRDVITARGYGDQYGHGTGHGVGLEVHESPRISKTANGTVPAGAVVTVEPGIYVPDWGGVRIEDIVVVTETGCEVLTPTPKELMVL